MDKELTSAASRGRADGGGICYALLCWVNTIAVSLPSNTTYFAITLAIFKNGSICPRKEFTLVYVTSILPPTDERFYFFIFVDFSEAFSVMLLSKIQRFLSLRFSFIFVHFTVLLCFCVCAWLCVLVSLYQDLPCWSLQKLILEICVNLLHQFIVPWKSTYAEMIQCTSEFKCQYFLKKPKLSKNAVMLRMLVQGYVHMFSANFLSKYSTEIFGNIYLHFYLCFAWAFPTDIYLFSILPPCSCCCENPWHLG